MTAYESTCFSSGQDCGTRVAACVARLAALELMDGSRWWNRWRRRLMARALVACAEELESVADGGGGCSPLLEIDGPPGVGIRSGQPRAGVVFTHRRAVQRRPGELGASSSGAPS